MRLPSLLTASLLVASSVLAETWIETFDTGVGRFSTVIDQGNSTFDYDTTGQDLDCVFFREPFMDRRLAPLGRTYTDSDSFGVVIEWTPISGSLGAFPHIGFFDSSTGDRIVVLQMTDNHYQVEVYGSPGLHVENNGTDWLFGETYRLFIYIDGEARSVTLGTWVLTDGDFTFQGIGSWEYSSTSFSIDSVGIGNLIEENPGPTLTADIDNAHFFAAGGGERLYIAGQSQTPVESSALLDGVTYELTVSGTYRYNSPGERADAEWHMTSGPEGPIWRETGDPGSGLDLLINGQGTDWLGSIDGVTYLQNTFSPSHVYKQYVTGDGSPLSFVISDSSSGDNAAGLLLEINPLEASQELVLAAATPSGNAPPTSWGPVLEFSLDGQSLTPLPGIEAGDLSDPDGIAVSSWGEIFVGNRHGNNGDGSIQRFLSDDEGVLTANGVVTGNGLSSVHQITFCSNGELLAANRSGASVSRFDFDGSLNAVGKGVISTPGLPLGVACSSDAELFVTFTSEPQTVRRYLWNELTDEYEVNGQILIPSAGSLHFMKIDSEQRLLVADPPSGSVFRCEFDAGGIATCGTLLTGVAGAHDVAFSDAGELLVAGHGAGGISRFLFDESGSPVANGFTATASLGGIAIYAPGDPCPPAEDGITLFVPSDFATIQSAIHASCPGDEVVVAPGTYNELVDFLGKAITLRSSGGRDVTTIDAGPVAGPGTGKPVVRCDSGEGPDTVLDGFTLTGGTGDNGFIAGDPSRLFGGGMFIRDSSPTITNSRFTQNIVGEGGGGMFVGNGSPTVSNCIFDENTAINGGGWLNDLGSPTVARCAFIGNNAIEGGGMFINRSDATVASSLFSSNTAAGTGGITGFGGGVRNSGSNPTITSCTFSGNDAVRGGGLNNDTSSHPRVSNSVFWGNVASVAGNEVRNDSNSTATVSLSDIQGSMVGGVWDTSLGVDAGGNIDADPLFVDHDGADNIVGTLDDNLRLLLGSPAIDSGDNSVVLELADLDGQPRIVDGDANGSEIVDMGAYELQRDPCPPVEDGIAIFVPSDFETIQGAISASCPGDEVVVAPGTYNELIDFLGKAITVRSSDGANVTIIDGTNLNSSVVTLANGEAVDTVIEGLTIAGGTGSLTEYGYLGGGMIISGSSPTVRDCIFRDNTGPQSGGAIMVLADGQPIISGCLFDGNSAPSASGGAVSSLHAFPSFENCIFRNNSCRDFGGGIYTQDGFEVSSVSISNCLFVNNTAGWGGAIAARNISQVIRNCTAVQNHAGVYGGGVFSCCNSYPSISNSILWDNSEQGAVTSSAQVHAQAGANVNWSLITEGWSGDGGIGIHVSDPLFVDFDGEDGVLGTYDDDFRLGSLSPAIDAGDNSAVPVDLVTDLDGSSRFANVFSAQDVGLGTPPIVDMGAYEAFDDCNENGNPDSEDLLSGLSADCNQNGIPDECDTGRDTRVAVAFHVVSGGFHPESWGPVVVFELDSDSQSLHQVAEIPKEQLSDPFGVVFNKRGELFVGNRHGNVPGAGSISHFRPDTLGGYVSTGVTVGNGLESVHQVTLGPKNELFAANLTGSVSRFLFDNGGNLTANGIINVADSLLSVAVSSQNDLLAGSGSTIYRFVFDELSGEAIAAGSFEALAPGTGNVLHTEFGEDDNFYFTDHANDLVYRCVFSEDGTPSCSSVVSIEAPVSVALAGGDLFVTNRVGLTHYIGSGDGQFVFNDFVDTSSLITSLGDVAVLLASEDCNGNIVPDECEEDCNGNLIPDDCDVLDGGSSDCDGNLVPDECESNLLPVFTDQLAGMQVCEGEAVTLWVTAVNAQGFQWLRNGESVPFETNDTYTIASTSVDDSGEYRVRALNNCGEAISEAIILSVIPRSATVLDLSGQDKNRYLSIGLTTVEPVEPLAIRIRPVSLDGVVFQEDRWAGAPREYADGTVSDPERTIWASRLVCEPQFEDWSSIENLHLFGGELIPNSTYEVQTIRQSCSDSLDVEAVFSLASVFQTATWGDVAEPYDGSGTPQPDFNDISAEVSAFLSDADSPGKTRAQLQPDVVFPDRPVDFRDISDAVSAFLGEPYSYHGPCLCPSSVPCGETACESDSQCLAGFCIDGFCTDWCGRCSE